MKERTRARLLVLTDASWEAEVIVSDRPSLVDFWAEWCLPSRNSIAMLEAAARRFEGRLKVGRLNVDESPAVTERYGIQGLPTLLLLKRGAVTARRVGRMDADDLLRLLDAASS